MDDAKPQGEGEPRTEVWAGFSLAASEGTSPGDAWTSDLQPPDIEGTNSWRFSHSVRALRHGSPGRETC